MHPVENFGANEDNASILKKQGLTTFKLAVGHYGREVMIFDLMEASDGRNYVFLDQKNSAKAYCEKPGISCLDSVFIDSK